MIRVLRRCAVAAVAVAAVLATPSALASPDGQTPVSEESNIDVVVGEGVPPGIPAKILRESFSALKASAPGREWLKTPEGRAHAAEVRETLRGGGEEITLLGGSADPNMCDDCGYDYDSFNDYGDTYDEAGGADGYGYYAACKSPYVVTTYRNNFGHDLWRYYQQLYFCWEAGGLTYIHRSRWAWVTSHWMNGWGFHGHVSTNCYSETCHGHWLGHSWARYWTQGKFEVCNLWKFGCRSRHPLIGIDVNAWGGWSGWAMKQ
jgi:hypothetical protein